MNAYLISIGDELLIGQTVNTNVSFLGNLLSDNNIDIIKSTVIGDDHQAILDEFNLAFNSAELIICTGGLGPTHDDITRNAVVEYFKTELINNEEVLEDVKAFVTKRGRELKKNHTDQALVPKIATAIRNENGTAPGIWIEKENKILVVMPGVPYEMKAMMNNYVIPTLLEKIGTPKEFIKKVTLQTTGLPESILAERLGDINELLNGAKLAFLPNQYG
ncbi:MAG: competence/damage-inducible protein A, partial [Ignavibacteriaceae bacterium]